MEISKFQFPVVARGVQLSTASGRRLATQDVWLHPLEQMNKHSLSGEVRSNIDLCAAASSVYGSLRWENT